MMNAQESRQQFLENLPAQQVMALFDLLPEVSFFMKNREGEFVALNKKGREFCGVATEEEAFGKTDFDFFPTDRAKAYHEDDLLVMETGQPVINRIEASPEPIPSRRLVVTNKLPILDSSRNIIGVAGFSRRVEGFSDNTGKIARFAKVVSYLHENYGKSVHTSRLAEMAGLSESQFNRRFRQTFGTSARQFLLRIRTEAAAQMLQETDATITTVAIECGFHDHAHLTRTFQRIMHCTPTQYRKRYAMIE